ncbi:hypothetical protein [Ralstonia phage RSP15]|uniref:hypothetical protein n=1 Tax=Ralstonia phage RSP15 TaxID=1785960 RepID=UPI00074D34BB|nr:hypothetical protein BH754_gp176 [Ralstonia phage RSP15]BAU40130.1 hypothetical protein [Ralstonia phage RSP15]
MGKLRNQTYQVVDNGEGKVAYVQIISGHYTGLTVSYGGISFSEQEDGATLHFDYDIVSNPYNVPIDDETLRPVLGDCLVDIIDDLMKKE